MLALTYIIFGKKYMGLIFAQENQDMRTHDFSQNQTIGGIVCFEGIVREFNNTKQVDYLFYEAYEKLAKSLFLELEEYVKKNYNIEYIQAYHRLGKTKVGECAVRIIAGAPHRAEAFSAVRFLIDELKKKIPIWKKEVYTDGSYSWGNNLCRCEFKSKDDFFAPIDRALKNKKITRDNLAQKKICVIGLGGLGCPIVFNLAAMGIKNFVLFDFDIISFSNLARQFFYTQIDIGEKKIHVCERFLRERFLDLNLELHDNFFDAKNNLDIIKNCDLVIEASDNFYTKLELKKLSWENKFNLIISSVYGDQGEIHVFNKESISGCLSCYQEDSNFVVPDCSQTGVLTHGCFVLAGYVSNIVLDLFSLEKKLDNFCLVNLGELGYTKKNIYKKDPGCFVCGPQKNQEANLFISSTEFLANQKNYALVDIRQISEQERFPINFTHKKLDNLLGLNIFSWLKNNRSKNIIFVCEQGARAHKLVLEYRKNGFHQVYYLAGGRRALTG